MLTRKKNENKQKKRKKFRQQPKEKKHSWISHVFSIFYICLLARHQYIELKDKYSTLRANKKVKWINSYGEFRNQNRVKLQYHELLNNPNVTKLFPCGNKSILTLSCYPSISCWVGKMQMCIEYLLWQFTNLNHRFFPSPIEFIVVFV